MRDIFLLMGIVGIIALTTVLYGTFAKGGETVEPMELVDNSEPKQMELIGENDKETEAARKQKDNADKLAAQQNAARQKQDADKLLAQQNAARKQQEDADRLLVQQNAARKQQDAADRLFAQQNAARKQQEDADKLLAQQNAARKQQEDADKLLVQQNAARKQQEDADRLFAQQNAARKQQEDADKLLVQQNAARKQQEDADKLLAQQNAARKQQEDADRLERERIANSATEKRNKENTIAASLEAIIRNKNLGDDYDKIIRIARDETPVSIVKNGATESWELHKYCQDIAIRELQKNISRVEITEDNNIITRITIYEN